MSLHQSLFEPLPKKADQEEKQKEEEAIPNAFIVQIQTDGGTVLSDSEPLKWEDTSLGKETAK